ncbi:MAG: glycosyltransferase [Cypionkella sp.]|uniref:glycosyltransferase n=1 Tax=Cypionkella sp. TaxID=2811411 RepID=UPI002ABA39F3|nr:glycosyltransferase [Cypionkella sp.]MDZ4313134.1 glycosyltransferase [Cypionkella sp.]
MAGRVQRVFDRYAARHLALQRPGPVLCDAAGQVIGQIARIAVQNDRLLVEGAAQADQVGLELAGRSRQRVPGAGAGGGNQFRLDLPFVPEAVARFSYLVAGQEFSLMLPGFSALRLRLARLVLWPRFGFASLWALPAAYRWLRYHDMGARARVKRLLGLGAMVAERQLEAAFLPVAPPEAAVAQSGVTILLPVYQAFDLLPEVLDRIARHTDLPWRLLVIEDASPDPQIRPFLRAWAAGRDNVVLLENERNLGFIGTVNRGFAEWQAMEADVRADPVVLLNSDAFLPAAWAARLLAPIWANPAVASVTPMSNDAELMSVPVICARMELEPGAGDAMDAVARGLGPGLADLPEAPTGVGFCMALNPVFLAQAPQFDPAFGRGYGEEVDWCQKIRALGGRHICQPQLFVEHRGGASFGSVAKQALLRQNGAIVSARHPRFDADVQRFIGDDPLLTARLALGLAWAGSLGRVPLYLAHAMGGGAEHDLQARIAQDLEAIGAAVVLRVGGEDRWEVALHSPQGITRAGSNDRALIERLLALLPAREVIYSCAVADPDPVEIPGLLGDLARGQRLGVLVHDFMPISPSYTLLDADGRFRGLPSPDRKGHDIQRPDGSRVGLIAWQNAWRPLLGQADEVVVFSGSSRDLMAEAYPEAADKLVLRPHRLPNPPPPLQIKPGPRPVIGVLGNIGQHKGAAVLAALARQLARSREGDLVLLGQLDPAYDLARPARVHGAYSPDQIAALVARYGISCWLIPSIWPETFSFTTHEALATGLPVICFDLGAQAEAVARAQANGAAGAVLALGEARPEALAEAVRAAVVQIGAGNGKAAGHG